MKHYIYILLIAFCTLGCQDNCSIKDVELINLLQKESLNKISYIEKEDNGLVIMWDGSFKSYELPIINEINIDSLHINNSFNIKDTIIDELLIKRLFLPINSFIDYSKEFGIVNCEINDSYPNLLGDKIFIGISKEQFFKIFFRHYNQCLKDIYYIKFPLGMNDNNITFFFEKNQLDKITLYNYPD